MPEPKDTVKSSMQGGNKDKNEAIGNIASNSENNENNSSKISLKETAQSEKEDARKIGSMLILKDRAMEVYSFSNNESSFYAGIINSFEERIGGSVKVYSLLAPTQVEFIENEKYKTMSTSQKKVIEYVNQHFNENIIPVNAYEALRSNRDKYLYFRTDHHWTALGAYYAYTAFADAIEEKPVPIEKYEVGKVEDYLGSTYSATLNKKLQSHPDTIYYYKPFIKHEYRVYYEGSLKMNLLDMSHATKKNKYRIFLSGDRPLGKITTEVQNGKKILIIKDSYGNAFVPFLLPHYNEIYIVDPRQFKKNIIEFVKENGIQEVLFLDYVPAANMKNFSQLILDMMTR